MSAGHAPTDYRGRTVCTCGDFNCASLDAGPVQRCTCARNTDGSVTTFLCSVHAKHDPCATEAAVTGKRRRGTIRRGTCTNCGWTAR